VDGYSGDAGNAMMTRLPGIITDANGMMFTTPDSDNDVNPYGSCAEHLSCGWWLGWCTVSNINQDADGMWETDSPPVADVQFSRMLVKLN